MKLSSGYLLWEGQSLLNGVPIAVILTGVFAPSHNRKTGPMIQSWILGQSDLPIANIQSGADEAVCGNCPLRRITCYVNPRTIQQIGRKYQQGDYPQITQAEIDVLASLRRSLRVTAYGDAAATPFDIWEPLFNKLPHTGYTHQWRNCDPRWRNKLMASVESPAGAIEAQERGWRSFRVVAEGAPLLPHETLCPNNQNPKHQCINCGLCDGAGTKPSIVDPVHGLNWKIQNFSRG
jgi:hypothetical protein